MKIFFFRKKIPGSAEEIRQLRKDRLLLITGGLLLALSFPPMPFPLTILSFVSLIPLLFVLERRNGLASINKAMYLFAFVFCLFTIYWVGSWQSEADPFLMIAGTVLLFFNPLLFLIPSTLFYLARKVLNQNAALFLMPFLWITYEYLYTLTDLSFPWLNIGHGLANFNIFIQAADIIGAMGLSGVVVLINILIYFSIKFRRQSTSKFLLIAGSVLIIFSLFISYGLIQQEGRKSGLAKVKVGIIQPDINPWDKWEVGGLNEFLNLYLELSDQAVRKGAKIIVWPETALPVYLFSGNYPFAVDRIYDFIETKKVYLLTGIPYINYYFDEKNMPEDIKYSKAGNYYYTSYNGIVLLSPYSKDLQKYGKMKLVPLGERVPFADKLPFLAHLLKWGVGLSGWNVGKDTSVFKVNLKDIDENKSGDSVKIGPLVCYESVYEQFVTEFVNKGANLISVVTNDSWYGKSSGPYQHKEFAVLRAVENRRSVIRCANGGISCVINQSGITEAETRLFTKNVLVADVSLNEEKTFYTKHPYILTGISSVISFWIFGINILIWLKKKMKL